MSWLRRKNMGKSYYGIFRMEFKGELQYRAKAISGVITQVFWDFFKYFFIEPFLVRAQSMDFLLHKWPHTFGLDRHLSL